jgi:tRNA(Ile)-lysidine synthase
MPTLGPVGGYFVNVYTLLTNKFNKAVAVSGGADSMALCYLLANTVGPARVHALTVDHQLRDESAQEAHQVSQLLQHQLGGWH